MATRPKLLSWVPSDDPLKVSEPIDTKKQNGFIYKERPPFQYLNWLFSHISKWLAYLDDENNQFSVSVEEVPSMSLVVSGGRKWDGVAYIKKSSQTIGPITAPSVDPRIDRIVINNSTLDASVVTGTEAVSPVAPDIPENTLPLAQVRVEPGDISIEQSDITQESSAYHQIATSSVNVSAITPQTDADYTLNSDENAAEVKTLDLSAWTTKHKIFCDDQNRKFTVENPIGGQTAIITTTAVTPVTVEIPPDGVEHEVRTVKGFGAKPVDNAGIGSVIAVQDNLVGVSIPPKGWYIKLSAGESGVGGYNEGSISSEIVSGVSPKVTATAVIVSSRSPLNGETIHLLNTEEIFLRAGNAGVIQDDQMQRITGGPIKSRGLGTEISSNGAQGALTISSSGDQGSAISSGVVGRQITFDSANSPNARVSGTTDGETRPRNAGITYYMRIA